MLTDAGGLLLLLPANLRLIMLIKLEVNLPFKNAHPTPTEISRSTVQQGWRQRWLSLFLSAYEAPSSCPFGFQPGRWYTGQEWRSRGSSDASFPRARCSQHTQSAPFWEMLGQKLCYMFCSPQRTGFPKNLFGSSSTQMKCIRHSSMTVRAQWVDWRNYNNLTAGFVRYLHPKVGSFTQSLSLPWSNAANTSSSELSVLWKLGQKRKDPSFTSLMCSCSC